MAQSAAETGESTSTPLCAMSGTKMLRRRDVLHAVNHLIRSAHLDRDERLADGNQVVALIIQRKIAAYYQALQVLNGLPVFINASTIEARSGETRTRLDPKDESVAPQGETQNPMNYQENHSHG